MGDWSSFSNLGQAIINKVKLGTAVDGPLVVTVGFGLACIFAYTIRPEKLLLFIAIGCLALYGIGYLWFMFTDSDKLRSEEHEQVKLQIAHGLGQSGKKEISEEKLGEMKSETNPQLKTLKSGKGDE